MEREINPANEEYYMFLEDLRLSGITNMYGATSYLEEAFDISRNKASAVLLEWMQNYEELAEKYGWR